MRSVAAVALASAALLLANEYRKGAVRPSIDPKYERYYASIEN